MSFIFKNGIVTLILLALIEFCASLFVNDSRYNQIYGVLHSHSDFLWRVRGNLEEDFFGAPLGTDAQGFRSINLKQRECKKRIGIFGASPSFGWGVEESEIYSSRLNQKFQRQRICFFNYSVIGFSSSQGQLLFKQIVEQEKLDAVIVSYLVNDVDFNRFYFPSGESDLEVMAKTSPFSLELWVQKLRDTSSFKWLRQVMADENNREIVEQSIVKTITYKRVKSSEFLENIDSMLKLSKEKGMDFYYLEMPVGIHVMAEYLKEHCDIPEDLEGNLEQAAQKIGLCEFNEYGELFKKKSSSSLDQVRSIIAMNRFRHYRKALREKMDSRKVIKVRDIGLDQLEKSFLSKNQDYVHPSSDGHRIIAEDIFSHFERED